MAWWIWAVAALLLAVVEVVTVDLIFLMLAGGAAAAAIASLAGAGLTGQAITFAVVSLILLFVVRPWAKSLLARSTPHAPMNAQGLVGQHAVVIEWGAGESGRINLDGEIWSARSSRRASYPVGLRVIVTEIDGATALVDPLEDAPPSGRATTELTT